MTPVLDASPLTGVLSASGRARLQAANVERVSLPPLDADLTIEDFIEGSVWTFAKTMKDAPHEYTLKDPASRAPALSPELFTKAVAFIREHGEKRKHGRTTYVYLEVGDWRYWTMGWPVHRTTLINRARIDDLCVACANAIAEYADSHADDCSRRPRPCDHCGRGVREETHCAACKKEMPDL